MSRLLSYSTQFDTTGLRNHLLGLAVGTSLILAGCSSQRNATTPRQWPTVGLIIPQEKSESGPGVPSVVTVDQPYTLMPGDMIAVDYSSLGPDGLPFIVAVDREGSVHFDYCNVTVHVQGLTMTEAAAAITDAFVPRYFRAGHVRVSGVQPVAAGKGRHRARL